MRETNKPSGLRRVLNVFKIGGCYGKSERPETASDLELDSRNETHIFPPPLPPLQTEVNSPDYRGSRTSGVVPVQPKQNKNDNDKTNILTIDSNNLTSSRNVNASDVPVDGENVAVDNHAKDENGDGEHPNGDDDENGGESRRENEIEGDDSGTNSGVIGSSDSSACVAPPRACHRQQHTNKNFDFPTKKKCSSSDKFHDLEFSNERSCSSARKPSSRQWNSSARSASAGAAVMGVCGGGAKSYDLQVQTCRSDNSSRGWHHESGSASAAVVGGGKAKVITVAHYIKLLKVMYLAEF